MRNDRGYIGRVASGVGTMKDFVAAYNQFAEQEHEFAVASTMHPTGDATERKEGLLAGTQELLYEYVIFYNERVVDHRKIEASSNVGGGHPVVGVPSPKKLTGEIDSITEQEGRQYDEELQSKAKAEPKLEI